jgi:hypothetical protein
MIKRIINVGWVGSISDEIEETAKLSFSKKRLINQSNLFTHRSALFYTPSENIPKTEIGSGELDIKIPIPTPDYTDFWELKAYKSPRLWVDLIQRQTFKIRWVPIFPAKIIITRFDAWKIRPDHLPLGTKALIDALKVKTTGRSDRQLLYYFGAIIDDGPKFVDVVHKQEIVKHPKNAGIRIEVLLNNKSN